MPVVEREKTHDDELDVLNHLLSKREKLQNNPELILKEIDDYNSKTGKLITIGPGKGKFLKREIKSLKPTNVFEFGTYIGYSSILIAIELVKLDNSQIEDFKIYTFEFDPIFYNISSKIVKLAGLEHIIELNYGKVSNIIEGVVDNNKISQIDFLFVDHWKYHYLPDLRIVESLGLISQNSVIFADNILRPGVPDYLEYIRQSPEWKQKHNLSVPNENSERLIGRYGLIYETTIEKAANNKGDIDGVAITKCIDNLN
ncbi:hypothetical protein WICMUC_004959 [Wickerhamomyces mucosus]|uniref:catechol O-methyltransferase n=1 Tax=Wickerhamomyces mucosus TaxID=1378264 RepID=A0A9P8PDY9_9ASCO|nr:hypothetical protein WICMUC_004959 [Wickerhamomyces mucosus]